MSSSVAAMEAGPLSSQDVAAQLPTTRKILVIICITVAVTTGVLYPLARWRAANDIERCGGDPAATQGSQEPGLLAGDPSLQFVVAVRIPYTGTRRHTYTRIRHSVRTRRVRHGTRDEFTGFRP